jgi:hypothetical protein
MAFRASLREHYPLSLISRKTQVPIKDEQERDLRHIMRHSEHAVTVQILAADHVGNSFTSAAWT